MNMEVIRPDFGYLACGDIGAGKMPDPEVLFDFIEKEVCYEKDLAGKKILVTAGPTREAIDPVRFITNHSSGKMGYAVAKAASLRGAEVTLVSGKTDIPKPRFVRFIEIGSAKEMFDAVTAESETQDAVIKAAAVADYRPKHDIYLILFCVPYRNSLRHFSGCYGQRRDLSHPLVSEDSGSDYKPAPVRAVYHSVDYGASHYKGCCGYYPGSKGCDPPVGNSLSALCSQSRGSFL